MKTATAFTTALLGAVLLAVPQAALAQEQEAENPHPREGFWFSGGLGLGSLGCEACVERETGTVFSLGLGGTVSQKVMLGASIDGWTKEVGGTRLTTSSLLATVRFYPSRTGGFFLRGGLGLGTIEVAISGLRSGDDENGPAALLGLGYDFRIGENTSLTPFLNGVGVSTGDADQNFNQLGLSVTLH